MNWCFSPFFFAVRQAGKPSAPVTSGSIIVEEPEEEAGEEAEKDYIKWVDFNVSYEALCQAYDADVETYGEDFHIDWISLLPVPRPKTAGEFGRQALKDMDSLRKNPERRNHDGRNHL